MKLLKFYGTFCAPCKVLTASLSSLNLKMPVEDIDVDLNVDAVKKYSIRGVPTLILLDSGGNELGRKVGALNAIQLEHWISQYD